MNKDRPIIVGSGPAGLFAALELIALGFSPLIFERGEKIEDRTLDVQHFIDKRELDPESNIQFGEGGAGSFSDGKLFSRIKNSSYASKVLKTYIKYGAPAKIESMRKPHLGSDVLSHIVKNMRNDIMERGGEIFYKAKMTDILICKGKACGIVINNEKEYYSAHIYLAIGHSARDTFELLYQKGVTLEQKPISIGVRIEHPVDIINRIRYGDEYDKSKGMEAANYSFTYTNREKLRGVYTFCMCPGGEVINASSEQDLLVLNGMSYSDRSSPFSNAALVVTCHRDDYQSKDPLAGITFQRRIEHKGFKNAGGQWSVPAQNLMDFMSGKVSKDLNKNSYKMGAVPVNMKGILPPIVSEMLCMAFKKWQKDYPLFVSHHAILFGPETRTSSPVRIRRNEKYESVNTSNLYPIGEGSGYAGGITSSATDAMKAVRSINAN